MPLNLIYFIMSKMIWNIFRYEIYLTTLNVISKNNIKDNSKKSW